jgi:hypothetical protein
VSLIPINSTIDYIQWPAWACGFPWIFLLLICLDQQQSADSCQISSQRTGFNQCTFWIPPAFGRSIHKNIFVVKTWHIADTNHEHLPSILISYLYIFFLNKLWRGEKRKQFLLSDKHLSSLKVYFRWKSESNFQSCNLLEEIYTTILHLKYMQMRKCLGDRILQSSLKNRISSLMYNEGLYNKLDT